MRYVVRAGEAKGHGQYLAKDMPPIEPSVCTPYQRGARVYLGKTQAKREAKWIGGRVVRLVSREEAKRRARAEGRAEGLLEAARVVLGMIEPARDLASVKVIALGSDVEDAYVRALERAARRLEQMAAGGGGER